MASYGKPKGWPGFPIPAHLFSVFVEWARNWPNWPPSKLNAIAAHKSEIDNGLIASPTNDGSSDRMLFVLPSVISNLEETWAMCPGQMSLCLPKCPSLSFTGQRPPFGLYKTKHLRWRTLFGNQAKCSKRPKNSMSWIWLKIMWGVHKHLLYHVQCTKTVFTAWFGCRSSESTTKSTRSGWFYLIKMAFCSKSLLTS